MTSEEAIIQLRIGPGINEDVSEEYNEAVEMAIKALEPHPTKHTEERTEMHEGDCNSKKGHWIMPQNDDGMSDPIYYQVRCSECNFDLDPQTWHQELHQYGADKYCPKCGAKMQEVKK